MEGESLCVCARVRTRALPFWCAKVQLGTQAPSAQQGISPNTNKVLGGEGAEGAQRARNLWGMGSSFQQGLPRQHSVNPATQVGEGHGCVSLWGFGACVCVWDSLTEIFVSDGQTCVGVKRKEGGREPIAEHNVCDYEAGWLIVWPQTHTHTVLFDSHNIRLLSWLVCFIVTISCVAQFYIGYYSLSLTATIIVSPLF